MVHTGDPSTLEVDAGTLVFVASLGYKERPCQREKERVMVAQVFDPSTWKVEARESQVQGHPWLHKF